MPRWVCLPLNTPAFSWSHSRTAGFPRFETLAFPPWAFPAWRGLSVGSHTPHFRGLPIASFHLMRQLIANSGSGCRAADETTKCPESLCPMSILKLHRGNLPRSPARTLLLGHRSYGLMRQSQVTDSPYFGFSPVRGVFAGCYQPLLPPGTFPTLSLRVLPKMPGPLPRRFAGCICLLLPLQHWPSPARVPGRRTVSTR